MTTRAALQVIGDYDSLFDFLSEINEAGKEPQVAGVDGIGRSFIATLTGCYADVAVAVMGNPWESSYDLGDSCDECSGQRGAVWPAGRLSYPITVLEPEPCSGCGGTGLVDWCPGQIRNLDDEQQPCPDCTARQPVNNGISAQPAKAGDPA